MIAPRAVTRPVPAALVLLVVLGGCRPREQAVEREADDATCPAGSTCIAVEDDDGEGPLGVSDVGHPTLNEFVSICRLAVRRAGTPTTLGFESATDARPRHLTILDGRVAEVVRCWSAGGHARAVLRVNPDSYAWAVPEPGDVFIPFDEDERTMLSDGGYARAFVERDASYARTGRICAIVGPSEAQAAVLCGLHVGDTFQWGTHQAIVARIVSPESPFTGWIEVRLG